MAIVQLDKILAGASGNMEHVLVYSDTAKTELLEDYTNGIFVVAEELVEGNREAKKARLAQGADKDILLVHSPELMYDEKKKLRDFVNAKGSISRAYRLALGDIITVTVGLLPEVSVGDSITVKDGKFATSEGTESLLFKVIEDAGNELDITEKAYALQVVQNG